MTNRLRICIVTAIGLTLVMLPFPAGAAKRSDSPVAYSSGFQLGAAHNGDVLSNPLSTNLKLAWAQDLHGPLGYPLVVGDSVYVYSGNDKDNQDWRPGGQLYAFDTTSGTLLWGPVSLSGTQNTASLAYDAGSIFVTSDNGLLRAFDAATGNLDWTDTLLGTPSAPVAAGGSLYLEAGTTLLSVNESSGSTNWSVQLEAGTTPTQPAVSPGGVYVSQPCSTAADFNPINGNLLWRYGPTNCSSGPGGVGTPSLFSGQLYVRDGDTVTANWAVINASSGSLTRTLAKLGAETPAFDGTTGYFQTQTYDNNGGSYINQLTAVDLTSGSKLWNFAPDGGIYGGPPNVAGPAIVVNGEVYVGTDGKHINESRVYALNANNANVDSETLMPPNYDMGDGYDGPSSLAIGSGLLFIPQGTKLVALENASDPLRMTGSCSDFAEGTKFVGNAGSSTYIDWDSNNLYFGWTGGDNLGTQQRIAAIDVNPKTVDSSAPFEGVNWKANGMPDYAIQDTPASGASIYARENTSWNPVPGSVSTQFSATGCNGQPFTEAYVPWSALSGATDGANPVAFSSGGPPFGVYSYVYDPYSHDASDVMPPTYGNCGSSRTNPCDGVPNYAFTTEEHFDYTPNQRPLPIVANHPASWYVFDGTHYTASPLLNLGVDPNGYGGTPNTIIWHATLQGMGSAAPSTPTGVLKWYDGNPANGGHLLGTSQLSGTLGSASGDFCTGICGGVNPPILTLAEGSHVIYGVYDGDAHTLPSGAAAVTQVYGRNESLYRPPIPPHAVATATNATCTYSNCASALANVTGTLTGNVPGDGFEAQFSTGATATSPAGKYIIQTSVTSLNGVENTYDYLTIPGVFTINLAPVKLAYLGTIKLKHGAKFVLAAKLTSAVTGNPISGEDISISIGKGKNQQWCENAATNAKGVESCTFKKLLTPTGPATITIAFGGDAPDTDTYYYARGRTLVSVRVK